LSMTASVIANSRVLVAAASLRPQQGAGKA
jgi:hypothetical protein